jgi:thioredoxin-related protein
LIIYSNLSWAQIKFEKFDWAQLSEISAKENKIIMIEMTATWCYWCKLMEKKVFPKKEVGDFFNSNFLNAKLYDNEEAAEEFAKKYKVESFPTFLFLDKDGKQIFRIDGAITNAKEFISEAKNALK